MMAPDRDANQWRPGKLWSLWDMLEHKAHLYMALGQRIGIVQVGFELEAEGIADPATPEARLVNDESKDILTAKTLRQIEEICGDLKLPVSTALVTRALGDLPRTGREFSLLMAAVRAELEGQRFFFVPVEKAALYDVDQPLSPEGMAAFPSAAQELRNAGNAYATDLPTASVYHSMRALEYGLIAFAADLNVTIGTRSWHLVIQDIETEIDVLRNGPNSVAKLDRLQFLSEAANEFRYFKDGWRNYASHVKVNYDDAQAIKALQHVTSFVDHLSAELKEAP